MKKLSILLIAAAVVFSGCKKDKETPTPVVPALEVSTPTVSVTAFAQAYEFTATSNVTYKMVSDAAWATVSTSDQAAGSKKIAVTIAKHDAAWTAETTPVRVANVTLTATTAAGTATKTVVVTQDGSDVTARFTDANFREALQQGAFVADKTKITVSQVSGELKTSINLTNVASTSGLEYLSALTTVMVDNSPLLTSIDFSGNTKLLSISCTTNTLLTTINVSKCPDLGTLSVNTSGLTSLDITKNTKLTTLTVINGQLAAIDLTNNTNLTGYIMLTGNKLTTIDITKCTKATGLRLDSNLLTSVDISKNVLLNSIHLENNKLTALDVSKNTVLTRLNVTNNKLTSINLTGTKVNTLQCEGNEFVTLNLGTADLLSSLSCEYNLKLTKLDISTLPALTNLQCYGNLGVAGVFEVKTAAGFDISTKPAFTAENPAVLNVHKPGILETQTITSNVKYVQ